MNDTRAIADQLVREWRGEASRRRGVYKSDPVPDVLEWCAAELAERLRAVGESESVTVETFARLHNVAPQTVRMWCRTGAVPAQPSRRGWRIPKGAAPPRRERRSA